MGGGAWDSLAAGSSPTLRLRLAAPWPPLLRRGHRLPLPLVIWEPRWLAPGSPDPRRRQDGTPPARGGCRPSLYPPTTPSPPPVHLYAELGPRITPRTRPGPGGRGGGGHDQHHRRGRSLPTWVTRREEWGVRGSAIVCLFSVTLMWRSHLRRSLSVYLLPRGLTKSLSLFASATSRGRVR